MAVRSIIQVDVDDAKFKAFNELFQKYNAQLGKMPEMWANIGKETEGAGSAFQVVTAALLANNEMMLKLVDAQHKVTLESEKTAGAWEHTVGYTHKVLDNIRSATGFLLKWGAIGGALSALGTIGGFFGMDRLAEGVASSRRSALGLGVSYGQQQAVNTAFGRFLDSPASVLSRIARGVSDVGSPEAAGLRGLGISQGFLDRADPAEVMVEVLRRVPGALGNVQRGQLGTIAQMRNITSILGIEDIKAILRSTGDIGPQIGFFRRLSGDLDVPKKTQDEYAKLLQTLDAAEKEINKIFVVQLAGLAPAVGHLATGFEHVVEAFLGSDTVKGWIATLGKNLDWLAGEFDKPEFKDGVESVISGLGAVGSALAGFLRWFEGKTVPATSQPNPHPRLFHGALLGGIFGKDKIDYDEAGNPLTTISTRGGSKITVGAPYADRIKGFLDALEGAGAPLGKMGGFADRPIDPRYTGGRFVWSPHALGYGFDAFSQSARDQISPEGRAWFNSHREFVREQQRIFGIKSGSDFRHKDTGHFEVIKELLGKPFQSNQPPTTSIPQGQGYGGGQQSQIYKPFPTVNVVVSAPPGHNVYAALESTRFGA